MVELVERALREKVEELRSEELERGRRGLAEDAPARVEAFCQAILVLIKSDLAGLYRALFLKERVEVPIEAPEKPTGEAIEGY